ncbi:hypothetical protein PoB_004028400 [Plakobranchus ocellatus]|uniref:Uncharacterized protein n=1 Tax=Plakobranchus ocellatus TaxID=259542 RepID=A0AAV4B510_9GAST|nr:hypothetical protein PoB_004028400 [Plakobranchus ocellatus]
MTCPHTKEDDICPHTMLDDICPHTMEDDMPTHTMEDDMSTRNGERHAHTQWKIACAHQPPHSSNSIIYVTVLILLLQKFVCLDHPLRILILFLDHPPKYAYPVPLDIQTPRPST